MTIYNVKNVLKAASVAALPMMGAISHDADAATIIADGASDIKAAALGQDTDPAVAGKSVFGQTRIIPSHGDNKTGTTQVYAVSENFHKSCMAGGGAIEKHAFQPAVYQNVVSSGTLDGLFNGSIAADDTVDLSTKRFNAPYVQVIEDEERSFVRIQVGYPVEHATVNLDGKNVDITEYREASGYTFKITDPQLVEDFKDTYLGGKQIQVAGISMHKTDQPTTTMAYSFKTQGGDLAETFQSDCVEKLSDIAVPASAYVSIKTEKIDEKEMPEGFKEAILGSQCLRGVKPDDIAEIHVINEFEGGISPFSHAAKLRNGNLVIADYFKQEPNGDIHISASWQQLENHTVNSCAGTIIAPKEPSTPVFSTPPATATATATPTTVATWTPPSSGGYFGGGSDNGHGHGHTGGGDGETPQPPPVPAPGTGGLLLMALATAAAFRRHGQTSAPEAQPSAAPKLDM